MERLPRVLPFWMMLLGIVGFFVLTILYFDVRGRETKNVNTSSDVGAIHELPQPESSEAAGTPPVAEEPVPLALPPQVPEGNIPSVAVYDCWRFDLRDDRIIVDRGYRDFGSDRVPLVTDQTIHLTCNSQNYVIRTADGARTFFLKDFVETDSALEFLFEPGVLYAVDSYTGKTTKVADVPAPNGKNSYQSASLSLTPDNQFIDVIWYGGIIEKEAENNSIVRISLKDGVTQVMPFQHLHSHISINQNHTTAIGTEWTCFKSQCRFYPVFLHRLNLITGKSIRVGELFDIDFATPQDVIVDPIFIDDERVVIAGEDTPAFVMNIYTRATAPIKKITATLDRLAITTNGKSILITGLNQPFTVIPVSELPKP